MLRTLLVKNITGDVEELKNVKCLRTKLQKQKKDFHSLWGRAWVMSAFNCKEILQKFLKSFDETATRAPLIWKYFLKAFLYDNNFK